MLPELLHYAIIAFPIVVVVLIVGKAASDKWKGLRLVK